MRSRERGTLMLDTLIGLLISVIILGTSIQMLTPTAPKFGTQAGAILAAAIAEAQADAVSTNRTQTVIVASNGTTSTIYEGAGNPYVLTQTNTVYHVQRTIPEVITASNGATTYTAFVICATANGTLTMGPYATLSQASLTTNPGCTYVNTLTVTMGPETLTANCASGVVTTDFPANI